MARGCELHGEDLGTRGPPVATGSAPVHTRARFVPSSSTPACGHQFCARDLREQPCCPQFPPTLRLRRDSCGSTIGGTPRGPLPGDNLAATAMRRHRSPAARRMAGFTSHHCAPHSPAAPIEGLDIVKFRVDRDVLADAVAWAARSLPVRPSVPVLAGLLIEAGHDGLVLSTFDYETSARATLQAEVADEGRALVCGRLLADICRSLPAKPVEMVIDGARVSLTCGSARFSLQTMPVEDYPTLPDDADGDRHRAERPVRPRRRPGGHRRRSRRHAPGADRRAARDRGLHDLAAGHRPVPALPPRARAGTRALPTRAWPRWCRPRCSATPPSR